MNPSGKVIVFYDGHCLLCSRLVRILLRADQHQRLYFSPLQFLSAVNRPVDWPDSIVLYKDGRFLFYSDAILEIFQTMGGAWKIWSVASLVPRMIRDRLYRFIARNRQRLFGRSDACWLPGEADKSRLILEKSELDFILRNIS
ncbi:MAG TPA: DCC1-like thiol-disulfide oxidoreductase family protein [Saprospiraceae bacterium]|nr:DCC1-like thiol-disulfide oxidoreductase family protein [Saprospiraceae bacterium]